MRELICDLLDILRKDIYLHYLIGVLISPCKHALYLYIDLLPAGLLSCVLLMTSDWVRHIHDTLSDEVCYTEIHISLATCTRLYMLGYLR